MAAISDFLKILKGVATTPVGFLIGTPLEGQNPLKTTMYHIFPRQTLFCLD